jgi:RNA polymerase primary sigma factor
MERGNRQEAFTELLFIAQKQGYVTFDNILEYGDTYSLPIQDFDWLSNELITCGILVYDEIPTGKISPEDDFDDYAQSDYEAVYKRIIELDESLRLFVVSVKNILPPQKGELSTLKYQVIEGNNHAKKRMVEMYLRFALRIALRRYDNYDMDIEDAIGEACIGLLIAVDRYDFKINGPFGSYVSMWILQNLSRVQPTRRPLVYYPVHKREQFFSVYSLLKERCLINELGVVDEEEARQLLYSKFGFTNKQIDDVINELTPINSLDQMIDSFLQIDNTLAINSGNQIPQWFINTCTSNTNIDEEIMYNDLKFHIAKVLGTLTVREQEVLRLRYGLDDGCEKTLEEIGKKFNVTRERIRQIESKALLKLRLSSRNKELIGFADFISDTHA